MSSLQEQVTEPIHYPQGLVATSVYVTRYKVWTSPSTCFLLPCVTVCETWGFGRDLDEEGQNVTMNKASRHHCIWCWMEELVPIVLKLRKQKWKVETQNLCVICHSNLIFLYSMFYFSLYPGISQCRKPFYDSLSHYWKSSAKDITKSCGKNNRSCYTLPEIHQENLQWKTKKI